METITWDCNPALRIPTIGCYIGTNNQYINAIRVFKEDYNVTPTFLALGTGIGISSASMSRFDIDQTVRHNVIPVLRFITSSFRGYRPIIRGVQDQDIQEFFSYLAEIDAPVIVIPFQQANGTNQKHYPWCNYPPSEYKDAWIRIHEICQKEGAKKVLFSTELRPRNYGRSGGTLDPFDYTPPDQYIDIIGWQVNNINKPHIGFYSQSFRSFMYWDYAYAALKYPTKPQMLWELSSERGPNQRAWMDDTLTQIQNLYARIKGVSLDETYYSGVGDSFGSSDPTPYIETKVVIRKHFNAGYYLSKPITG